MNYDFDFNEVLMETLNKDLVVLGGGPGAYSAAFRAADLGQKVTIIEKRDTLGGVCLNVGCIPSKTYLHTADLIFLSREGEQLGVNFSDMKIDINTLRERKKKIVGNLTKGLSFLAKKRNVEVITGVGEFMSNSQLKVTTKDGDMFLNFKHAIIAAGSRPVEIPGFPNNDPRMWDSTDALEIPNLPARLLVLGGGVIGLEMATVYNALGSDVTVVEMFDQILPPADKDAAKVMEKRLKKYGVKIITGTRLESISAQSAGLLASYGGKEELYDNILISVGRVPNTDSIGLEKTDVATDDKKFIIVDEQLKTSVPHIFAVGDIVGQPMLAHKSANEGKVAAEVISGMKSAFIAKTIPSVAYTIPEVAWTGLTEKEAKEKGIEYTVGKFPFSASGRAMVHEATDGFVKILFDKETKRVIGGSMVGPHAGDMLTEVTLALEMGADMEDIALTIHPHPTLGETIGLAAEVAHGTVVDL
jgi:dihydrolipoamide dehydrogenase